MRKIKVGVLGATGYAGAELCRILLGHPDVQLCAIGSVSFEGKLFSEIYPAMHTIIDIICEKQEAVIEKSDVIFAALPHGLSEPLAKTCCEAGKLLIDLGADFRLREEAEYQQWYHGTFNDKNLHEAAVYGLPECFRNAIKQAKLIANPGCYTTAVPLALYPALKYGLIEPAGIIADCKSGVTGAGRTPTQSSHYPELNENIYAYKIATHRHTPEIEQTLTAITKQKITITFVPHLLPVSRGILATCYAKLKSNVTKAQLQQAYTETYQNETFVRLRKESPQIRNVRYSNYCDVSFIADERTQTLIAVSAIDNLVKGAAGQAIQNMNISLGLQETTGLMLLPPVI